MNKIPFSVYDFFAYLSSGAVLVATADYIWGLGLLARTDIGALLGVAILIITYVVGQTVAHFSSFFLEQIVVHRMLKRPSFLLMGAKPSLKPFKWLFPNNHRALAPPTMTSAINTASRGTWRLHSWWQPPRLPSHTGSATNRCGFAGRRSPCWPA
jgi:hypothetical protein